MYKHHLVTIVGMQSFTTEATTASALDRFISYSKQTSGEVKEWGEAQFMQKTNK